LGVAQVALAWHASRGREPPAWVGLAIAAFLGGMTISLYATLDQLDDRQVRRSIQADSEEAHHLLLERRYTATPYMATVAEAWRLPDDSKHTAWERLARRSVSPATTCAAIGWADDTLTVRNLVSRSAFNLVDKNLADLLPEVASLSQDQRRTLRITRSLRLGTLDRVVFVLIPLSTGGYLFGVFPTQQHLQAIAGGIAPAYSFIVTDEGGTLYRRILPGSRGDYAVTRQFSILGTIWKLRFEPTETVLAQKRSAAPRLAAVMGTALTILLPALVGLTGTARRRARRLRRACLDLRREIGDRRRAEERYRSLFEGNPVPMWVFDVETLRFLEVNSAAVTHYGYTREEFLTLTISAIHSPGDVVTFSSPSGCERTTRGVTGPWSHRRKDGSVLQTEVWSHAIDVAGRRARLVLALDITERGRLEAQLRQAQKMEAIGQLAGGVAHDFNNLLTVINGYSDLLRTELHGNEPLVGLAQEIGQAGERAAALTSQLLAFSRQQILRPAVLDLNDVVAGTKTLLCRLIGADIELAVVLDAALPHVRLDAGQMTQVLLNLAVNARDAMPQGGRLEIATASEHVTDEIATRRTGLPPGDYVRLTVTDTGCGMDASTLSHMFEPFFTTKEFGRGTGLGLATVYGIVKQSGGHIYVDSSLGKGSSFVIYLPPCEAPTSSPDAVTNHPVVPVGGKETILLVEDEEGVRSLLRTYLCGKGYTVLEAADGEAALRVWDDCDSPIDLLITDMVMPRMNGRQLVDRLTVRHPDLKVLFLSGYTDDELLRRGNLTPGRAFLEKPFSIPEFGLKLRDILANPSVRSEAGRVTEPGAFSVSV